VPLVSARSCARFSPGILLTLHMLARSVPLGLRSFELLGVPEPHKQMWNPVKRPCVTLRAYPYGPRGLVLLGSDAAWLALSRLRKLAHSRRAVPILPRAVPIPRQEVSLWAS
jgi:CelD/BcsL family acetyltransferase involved in cellulose biosynthesis